MRETNDRVHYSCVKLGAALCTRTAEPLAAVDYVEHPFQSSPSLYLSELTLLNKCSTLDYSRLPNPLELP